MSLARTRAQVLAQVATAGEPTVTCDCGQTVTVAGWSSHRDQDCPAQRAMKETP